MEKSGDKLLNELRQKQIEAMKARLALKVTILLFSPIHKAHHFHSFDCTMPNYGALCKLRDCWMVKLNYN